VGFGRQGSWRRAILWGENFLHERFEARVAAEIVKHWIDLDENDITASSFAVRSFHLVN
jgi:hypothetical protein